MPDGRRQTKWKASYNVQYRSDGTFRYTEDGVKEHGTFQVFEGDQALLEEVTDSDVKEKIGRKTQSKINFLADHLTLVTTREFRPNLFMFLSAANECILGGWSGT